MVLASRIERIGETPHAHEREGLRFIEDILPNSDPFFVWELFELVDPGSGRLLEIDALVMGYSALYLLELKGGPGEYDGDSVDWYRTPPGEPRRYMDAPFGLANFKAKVLKSRLEAAFRNRAAAKGRLPRVEALVFLSAADVTLRFTQGGDLGVVTRKTLKRALQFNEYPGSAGAGHSPPIQRPLAKDIAHVLKNELGLRPRKGKLRIGDWQLEALLSEGEHYQDRLASHTGISDQRRRARTYLVPLQTSVELRQQLRRAADREAQLLFDVRDHNHVLRIEDYQTDAAVGPTVFFEHFDGLPLDTFLRHNPKLEFGKRIEIIEQVGRALVYCHRRRVIHGGLSPESILVRQDDTGCIQTRLYNFQLARGSNVSSTRHLTAFTTQLGQVYQAPEVIEDQSQRSEASDLFSLGAVSYFLLTGQPPAKSAADLYDLLTRSDGLNPLVVDSSIPAGVAELIRQATLRSPVYRGGHGEDDLQTWLELLEEQATGPAEPEPSQPEVSPLDARKDDLLAAGTLRVEGILGQGASSRVLLVTRLSDERPYALKCSLSADQDARLDAEAEVLRQLRHPRVVQCVDVLTMAGRQCLLLSVAGDRTLHRELSKNGVVSLDYASRYGEDLLSALELLEEKALIHRDIKPANLGVGAPDKRQMHLTLFDFSLAAAALTDLDVGTSAYRDPFLRQRGAWDIAADRFSAAVTLHEMLTGSRPKFPVGMTALDSAAELQIAAERFDASVRGRLTAFFTKAFLREASQRHESALSMRHAWVDCFEVDTVPTASGLTVSGAGAIPGVLGVEVPAGRASSQLSAAISDDQLRAITPEQSVEALPLSTRAKNALDRIGVLRMAQLLDLPDNHLSAVRGVGREVAREILKLRDRWCAATHIEKGEQEQFFPHYRGDDLRLTETSLAPAWAGALEDAGLRSLARVAQAPRTLVESLASRHAGDLATLREVLEKEQQRAAQRAEPTQIEDFID